LTKSFVCFDSRKLEVESLKRTGLLYIYIYIDIYIYLFIFIYIYIFYIYIYIYIYIYVYIYIYIIYIHTHTYTYIHRCIYRCPSPDSPEYTSARTVRRAAPWYMYTYICIYILTLHAFLIADYPSHPQIARLCRRIATAAEVILQNNTPINTCAESRISRFGLYKIFYVCEAFLHATTILSFAAQTYIAQPDALLLCDYWAVYNPPSGPPCVCNTPYHIGDNNIV